MESIKAYQRYSVNILLKVRQVDVNQKKQRKTKKIIIANLLRLSQISNIVPSPLAGEG